MCLKASINKLDLWKETQTKGNLSKENRMKKIKVLLSEMLCIYMELDCVQLKANLSKRKSSNATLL